MVSHHESVAVQSARPLPVLVVMLRHWLQPLPVQNGQARSFDALYSPSN